MTRFVLSPSIWALRRRTSPLWMRQTRFSFSGLVLILLLATSLAAQTPPPPAKATPQPGAQQTPAPQKEGTSGDSKKAPTSPLKVQTVPSADGQTRLKVFLQDQPQSIRPALPASPQDKPTTGTSAGGALNKLIQKELEKTPVQTPPQGNPSEGSAQKGALNKLIQKELDKQGRDANVPRATTETLKTQPVPTPVSTPVPTPKLTPTPTPSPTPTPKPTPSPTPTPTPTPRPTPTPEPKSLAPEQPKPTPTPTPTPVPRMTPTPTPQPILVPTPLPEPGLKPVPTPKPTPTPTPEPALRPTPTPEPQRVPVPTPLPESKPTPAPQPVNPVSQPKPGTQVQPVEEAAPSQSGPVDPAVAEWVRASSPESAGASIPVDPALPENSKRLILSRIFADAALQSPASDPVASLQPEDQPLYQRIQVLTQKAQQGQKAEMVRQLAALAEAFPNSPLTPEILFRASLFQEETSEQRIQGFYRVIQRDPKTLAARKSALALAETFVKTQDFPYALDAFKAYALAQGPGVTQPVFHLQVATCLMRLRNYQGALDQLNGVEWGNASVRTLQKALDLKGECLAALGRAKEAQPLLRAFIQVYPDYALAAKVELTLGFCSEELNQMDEAKKVYGHLAQTYAPDSFEALTARSRLAVLQTSLFAAEPPKSNNPAAEEVKRATPKTHAPEENIQAQKRLEGPGESNRPPVSTPEMLYAPPVLNAPEKPEGPQGENLLGK